MTTYRTTPQRAVEGDRPPISRAIAAVSPSRRIDARCLLITVAVVVAGWITAPVAAQSDAELRSENATLRTRVRDLEIELAAARERIEALRARIAELERAAPPAVIPEGTGVVPPPPEPTLTIDENDPMAAPLNLLRRLRSEHAEAEPAFGSYTTPRGRELYLRNLRRWVTNVNRRYRGPVEWLVTADSTNVVHTDRFVTLRLTAIDPGTGDALGDPFPATLTPTQFRRFESAIRRGRGSIDRLVLRGTLVPQVEVNPQRDRAGHFEFPRYIGTFCEFGLIVEGVSLLPADQSADESDEAGDDERNSDAADERARDGRR